MNDLKEKQIIFFGGKGGVGKSTSSAAYAIYLAKQGYKTLLVSTDPAHNLSDIFNVSIGGKIRKVRENLHALEIDSTDEASKYIATVKDNLKGLVKSSMVNEVHRQIDLASASPGAEEAALFDRMVSLIIDEHETFEKIVFDTAPTGHTIRLLTLPELMGVWIEGMLERREKVNKDYSQYLGEDEKKEDPIYGILNKRKQRFAKAREILLDGHKTGMIFVLNPEKLPILETKKAIHQLDQFHLHVRHLVVNKILPDILDSDFFQKRKQLETEYLQMIKKEFTKQHKVYIPLLDEDITSVKTLDRISEYFEENE